MAFGAPRACPSGESAASWLPAEGKNGGEVETGAVGSTTGPAKVYQAGETFFEPAGSRHLVSENASATEPARLLAVFVADAGAQLTTQDK